MRTGKTSDDWIEWKPINSTISDGDIKEFENNMGFNLPTELVQILKHRHFVELHVGNVELFSMPSSGWQFSISQGIYDSWPSEFLIEKGYLPFAIYSDWGLWCFNLNEKSEDGVYPIYLWDHEDAEQFQYVSQTLKVALNIELENNA
ncbi:MAG: SMI1/KNR4 family protein [Gammaproteobacteria bacterium]|nr:SMI1/KNR4 family protein [Gammaproteobacteria bacterium]